jgi:ribonuclease Z
VLEGFTHAYEKDRGYRIAHHGEGVLPPSGFGAQARSFQIEPQGRKVLISEPDLEIVAFAVEHEPVEPAVGYRIRYKDRSLVISGDTRRCDAMTREAKGVDVLMHEALSPTMSGLFEKSLGKAGRAPVAKVFHDILDYHTSPEQAGEIAQAAGVRMLVLHHILPMLPPGFEDAFLENTRTIYRGPVHVAVDGDWITMPAGSTKIELGRRR